CCAFCSMAEMKILAFVDFDGAQPAGEDLSREFVGRGPRELNGEGNHQQRVQAFLCQQGFLLSGRSDQPRGDLWPQDLQRMWIECDHNRACPGCPRALNDFLQDLLMAAMHAVEISHADNAGPESAGNFGQCAKDSHAISNSSLRPSCARRTCAGNDWF